MTLLHWLWHLWLMRDFDEGLCDCRECYPRCDWCGLSARDWTV